MYASVCVCLCVSLCMHVCMYLCVYICVCTIYVFLYARTISIYTETTQTKQTVNNAPPSDFRNPTKVPHKQKHKQGQKHAISINNVKGTPQSSNKVSQKPSSVSPPNSHDLGTSGHSAACLCGGFNTTNLVWRSWGQRRRPRGGQTGARVEVEGTTYERIERLLPYPSVECRGCGV